MTAVVVAETQRLTLRPILPGDLDAFVDLLSDRRVMRFSTGVMARDQVAAWIDRWQSSYECRGHGMWAVVFRDAEAPIGCCGLVTQDVDGASEIEIGYRLLPAYWGQGIATEAACAARDIGFDQLGLARLISLIDPANGASIRVAEKVGMQFERETFKWGAQLRVYAVERHELR
jgi:ribosomal-protein-alanine N-acetyltransferase